MAQPRLDESSVAGHFVRSFVLPDNVDPTKVTASMKDGVLEVRLVKAEQAKPKQIEISVN